MENRKLEAMQMTEAEKRAYNQSAKAAAIAKALKGKTPKDLLNDVSRSYTWVNADGETINGKLLFIEALSDENKRKVNELHKLLQANIRAIQHSRKQLESNPGAKAPKETISKAKTLGVQNIAEIAQVCGFSEFTPGTRYNVEWILSAAAKAKMIKSMEGEKLDGMLKVTSLYSTLQVMFAVYSTGGTLKTELEVAEESKAKKEGKQEGKAKKEGKQEGKVKKEGKQEAA